MKQATRFWTCLSLANLCFLPVWYLLLPHSQLYMREQMPPRTEYAAAILCVVATAAVFWAIGASVLATGNGALQGIALAGLVFVTTIPLNVIKASTARYGALQMITRVVLIVYLIGGVVFALRAATRVRVARALRAALLIVSPFLFLTVGRAAWFTAKPIVPRARPTAASPATRRQHTRVVWIVFDELDQRIAFDQRPATLRMPNLDRLRARSLSATTAYPPSDWTLVSMPALVTGHLLTNVKLYKEDDLLIKPLGATSYAPLTGQKSIFTDVRDEGGKSAVIGWYHPYCRMFDSLTAQCGAHSTWMMAPPTARSAVERDAETVLRSIPGISRFLDRLSPSLLVREEARVRRAHLAMHRAIEAEAERALRDDSIDLVFLHWPIPHDPYVFDRKTGQLTDTPGHSYLDNLALTDAIVGTVQSSIAATERAGSTAIIISGDHSWRKSPEEFDGVRDYRVPFIVSLPGETTPTSYTRAFNTFATRTLAHAIMRGEIRSGGEAAAWLDKNVNTSFSPTHGRSEFDVMR